LRIEREGGFLVVRGKKASAFFFEKKKQKTFIRLAFAPRRSKAHSL
jgi:hypothetical protein